MHGAAPVHVFFRQEKLCQLVGIFASNPFQTDTDKAVKLQEEHIKQVRKHPSLGYTGNPAKGKLPAAKVAA